MPSTLTIWLYFGSALAVAVLSLGLCVVHRVRARTRGGDYGHGALTWTVSVAVKIGLAIAVFWVLRRLLGEVPPMWIAAPITGLLTGVTECVLTYLVAMLPRWRTARWSSAVGFGLGFGCFEALVLALPIVFAALAVLLEVPMSPEDRAELLRSFADPWRPLTFFHERAIAVPVHLLASVLLIRAAQTGRGALFWYGFVLKSLIDAVPAGGALPEAVQQAIYAGFGIGSLLIFLRVSGPLARGAGDA